MNKKELKKAQDRLESLYEHLEQEIGSSTMDIVQEIVAIELEIEKECNM